MALSERNPSRARQLQVGLAFAEAPAGGLFAQARAGEALRARWLERENARLTQQNERLRQECADLSASADLWIGLYEAALLRAGKAGH